MMEKGNKKIGTTVVITIVIISLFLAAAPLRVSAADPTLVQVSPASITVSGGQTFSLDIACVPGQLIKAYELKVSFDPSLLQANLVTEGTIFNGYTTYFNAGVIDNNAGTIINVYGLIQGTGGVLAAGSLVSISFTAQAASGTSSINLYDVGVTNESTYVPITVTNGTVTLRQFTLDVTTDGSGSVVKNPNQATYPYGTVVQLTASGSTGWSFSHWSGDASGSSNPVSVTMNANKSVVAHFTQNQYTLTVTTDGSGSVSKNPNQATYAYGTVVQLTASGSMGWTFSHWSGDASGSSNPVSVTMNGNRSVVAHFTQNQYTLTVNVDGLGSVTKNPDYATYAYGEVVTLTAVPSAGWMFTSWSGDKTGSENPTTITITGNHVVVAHFSDSAPPLISGITRLTSDPLDTNPSFGWVNISCTVTDNVAVSQVILRIRTPSGTWNNVSMIAAGSGTYYYYSSSAFSSVGNYTYSIWAVDSSSNAATSDDILFSMPPNWDINLDGWCTIMDLNLIANHYNEVGAAGWIREDVDNNGFISVLDLVFVAIHFGETWW